MKTSTIEDMSRDIVEKIQISLGQNEILDILQSIASQFDFEYFTYSRMFPKTITRVDLIAIGNYPEEWINEYLTNKYIFIDPVMKHCTSSTSPFYWKNIFTNKNEDVINFSKACSKFGLKEGFSIGINGNYGDFSLLNFGRNKAIANQPIEFSPAVIITHIILPYLHEKLAQIHPVNTIFPTNTQQYPNSPLQDLTDREKKCLLWTAEGKTSHKISVILKISESTVNFHLKNITIKLDCANKTHAVAKAVLLGPNKNISE